MRSKVRTHIPGALICATALCIGGCAESDIYQYLAHSDTLTVGAGNAQAANRAIHEVDHWPIQSRNTRIDQDGQRAALAVKRYQKNESVAPRGLTKRDISISIGEPGAALKQ